MVGEMFQSAARDLTGDKATRDAAATPARMVSTNMSLAGGIAILSLADGP